MITVHDIFNKLFMSFMAKERIGYNHNVPTTGAGRDQPPPHLLMNAGKWGLQNLLQEL